MDELPIPRLMLNLQLHDFMLNQIFKLKRLNHKLY